MLTESELCKIKDDAVGATRNLSQSVLTALNPKPGPHSFFYVNGHLQERLDDCWRICERLYRARERITEIAIERRKIEPKKWPAGKPYPEDVQKLMHEAGELTNYMKLDLESLYIFGTMALDQWGLQAIHLGTLPLAKRHPFVEVVAALEENKAGVIQRIWPSEREKMLWLHYQIRFYRNRFVTHTNRPWQRGNTRLVYGEDFRLFTPTPPGWLDDSECDREIMSLIHLAPDHIQRAPKSNWEREPRALIERLFDTVGQLENRTDREHIAELYGKVGGQTPSFQTIAERLFDFVRQSTSTLTEIAVAHPEKIDLGPPTKLTQELLAEALRKAELE